MEIEHIYLPQLPSCHSDPTPKIFLDFLVSVRELFPCIAAGVILSESLPAYVKHPFSLPRSQETISL